MLNRNLSTIIILTLSLLISSCSSAPESGWRSNHDGAILIGFDLSSTTDKSNLKSNSDRVLSINLKNLDDGNRYRIRLARNNFGITKLTPGTYCVSKVTTYQNLSIPSCDLPKIVVHAGELKNAGYWLAHIKGGNSQSQFELTLYDTDSHKLDLYEKAYEHFDGFFEKEFLGAYRPEDLTSIVGVWYGTLNGENVFHFKNNGKYDHYGETSGRQDGLWRMKGGLVLAKYKATNTGMRIEHNGDRLNIDSEDSLGKGFRMVAYRNPIRIWGYETEFNSLVVEYNRKILDKISQDSEKSLVVRVKFDTQQPLAPERLGKQIAMYPTKNQIIDSNMTEQEEKIFSTEFLDWRFGSLFKNKTLTICMIVNDIPKECLKPDNETLVFQAGKKFVVNNFQANNKVSSSTLSKIEN